MYNNQHNKTKIAKTNKQHTYIYISLNIYISYTYINKYTKTYKNNNQTQINTIHISYTYIKTHIKQNIYKQQKTTNIHNTYKQLK